MNKNVPTPTGPAQEPSDTEMLDWIERHGAGLLHSSQPDMGGRDWTVFIESRASIRAKARSPRHAIAAAMKHLNERMNERPPATAQGEGS